MEEYLYEVHFNVKFINEEPELLRGMVISRVRIELAAEVDALEKMLAKMFIVQYEREGLHNIVDGHIAEAVVEEDGFILKVIFCKELEVLK